MLRCRQKWSGCLLSGAPASIIGEDGLVGRRLLKIVPRSNWPGWGLETISRYPKGFHLVANWGGFVMGTRGSGSAGWLGTAETHRSVGLYGTPPFDNRQRTSSLSRPTGAAGNYQLSESWRMAMGGGRRWGETAWEQGGRIAWVDGWRVLCFPTIPPLSPDSLHSPLRTPNQPPTDWPARPPSPRPTHTSHTHHTALRHKPFNLFS